MFHAVILFVDFSAFLVEPPLRIRITVDLIDEFPSRIAQPSHPIEINAYPKKASVVPKIVFRTSAPPPF